ncbi:RNA polymerase sigma factor [Engelhardtia mirabilis]|uniref:RNA polymerase sigma factor n=1 Tax=Engelhardtia mirabilis TaxID=2528011 RepID=UPI003AF404E3
MPLAGPAVACLLTTEIPAARVPGPRSRRPADDHDRLTTRLMADFRDSRDTGAFDDLYRASFDSVLIWVRSLLRQGPAHLDAYELVQDTFVNVYRYPASFRDEHDGSFRVWVRTIAGNVVRRARGRLPREGYVELPEGGLEPADNRCGPAVQADMLESVSRLDAAWPLLLAAYHSAWSELAERDRLALELVEVDGLTYSEASKRLKVRASNMKMIVFRARRRLFAHLRGLLAVERAQAA